MTLQLTCQSAGRCGLRAMYSLRNWRYTGRVNIASCISEIESSIMRAWCVTNTDTALNFPSMATMSFSLNIFLFFFVPLCCTVSSCHMVVKTGLPASLSQRGFRRQALSTATRRGDPCNPPSPPSRDTSTRMDLKSNACSP